MALINSPVGIKTVHFWGPAANWGIVGAGILDAGKPAEMISSTMTPVLFIYSCMFMRFAWRVSPRNILLFTCHFSNCCTQAYLFARKYKWSREQAALAGKQ